jgi:hypothetical protein
MLLLLFGLLTFVGYPTHEIFIFVASSATPDLPL